MSRVFLTGDTHGKIDIRKLNSTEFPTGKDLTKDDFLIILGDFGLVWDGSDEEKYWQKWLNDKPWTTLFLAGNHENFDLLKTYSTINHPKLGNVRKISDSIYQLLDGHMYEINGKSFFVMGGATSIDKEWRTPGKSWWAEEIPSWEILDAGIKTLELHGNEADYILTHCAPSKVVESLGYQTDILTDYLDEIEIQTNYLMWFCGHYHIDKESDDGRFIILYDAIIELI